MASLDAPLFPGFPSALLQAVAHQAARDADLVALFLDELGCRLALRGEGAVPAHWPSGLLLGLGAALRLLAWERNGARALLPVVLPDSREAIRDLFAPAAREGERPGRLQALAHELTLRVLRVWLEHFAWHGREEWGADLVLGAAEEDALVDALAGLLWENRHALDAREGGEG
jgi:hypothetical protein